VRRTVAAIGLGLCLASLPFVRYRFATPHPTAHADHRPRHGGELVMAGDVHLELVRHRGSVALNVSDGYRRPIEGATAEITTAAGRAVPLEGTAGRLRASFAEPRGSLRVTVRLPGGGEAGATFAGGEP
jgi:hypothetical protein